MDGVTIKKNLHCVCNLFDDVVVKSDCIVSSGVNKKGSGKDEEGFRAKPSGEQIPSATSPGRLNFVRWPLLFVGRQYVTLLRRQDL